VHQNRFGSEVCVAFVLRRTDHDPEWDVGVELPILLEDRSVLRLVEVKLEHDPVRALEHLAPLAADQRAADAGLGAMADDDGMTTPLQERHIERLVRRRCGVQEHQPRFNLMIGLSHRHTSLTREGADLKQSPPLT
jgi:hypothetical protein